MRSYHGKILLFGEYVVLFDGLALTMPSSAFYGTLKIKAEEFRDNESNAVIRKMAKYLSDTASLSNQFNHEKLNKDIRDGLYFDSNIPQGYGIGSSGALVAAIWDNYGLNKASDVMATRHVLAEMECFFHGSSSGVDPLTSFVNQNLLFRGKDNIEIQNSINTPNHTTGIALIDLGFTSETKHLVEQFIRNLQTNAAKNQEFKDYAKISNKLVRGFLENNTSLFSLFDRFMLAQKNLFPEMLTQTGLTLIDRALKSDDYKVKLCGSGGGGFLLLFYKKSAKSKVESALTSYKIWWIN